MTTKDRVIHAVQELPDDSSIEDVMERLLFMAKVERGIQQADAGKTMSHGQVREKMANLKAYRRHAGYYRSQTHLNNR